MDVFRVDADTERDQVERVRAVRTRRDAAAWRRSMAAVTDAARSGSNIVDPILAAVEACATVGEISDALRQVFGEYAETATT